MTAGLVEIETAAPGLGAVCGAWLVSEGLPATGLVFFTVSLAVYVFSRRPAR